MWMNHLAQGRTDRKCPPPEPPISLTAAPVVLRPAPSSQKHKPHSQVTSRQLAGLSSSTSRFCLKPARRGGFPARTHPSVCIYSVRSQQLPGARAANTLRLQHASLHPFQSPPLLAFLGSLASHPPFSLPAMWLDFRGAPGWGGTGKNNTQDVVGGRVRNGCKDPLDSSPVSFQFFFPFFLPMHSCITLQDTGSEMSGFTGVGLEHGFLSNAAWGSDLCFAV